jgi:hypothetical protein
MELCRVAIASRAGYFLAMVTEKRTLKGNKSSRYRKRIKETLYLYRHTGNRHSLVQKIPHHQENIAVAKEEKKKVLIMRLVRSAFPDWFEGMGCLTPNCVIGGVKS